MIKNLSAIIISALLTNAAYANDLYRMAQPSESIQKIAQEILRDTKQSTENSKVIEITTAQVRQLIQMTNTVCPNNKINSFKDSFLFWEDGKWQSSMINPPRRANDNLIGFSSGTSLKNHVSFMVIHDTGHAIFDISPDGKLKSAFVGSVVGRTANNSKLSGYNYQYNCSSDKLE